MYVSIELVKEGGSLLFVKVGIVRTFVCPTLSQSAVCLSKNMCSLPLYIWRHYLFKACFTMLCCNFVGQLLQFVEYINGWAECPSKSIDIERSSASDYFNQILHIYSKAA